jgi:tetratricopeptide (TPR) repeat protein
MSKNHIFISHSTKDNEFVKALRKSLEIQNLQTWVDSRELSPGDELNPKVKQGIEEAQAFILVISQNAFNSPWVLKETKHALKIKKKRSDDYRIIPLLLEGVEPAALQLYFKEVPLGLKVEVGPGGISEAMPRILAGLGKRLPEDAQPMLRPMAEPIEELLLELTDPCMVEKDGLRRAQATARLTYFPSEEGKREVSSEGRFVFTSPLGPIEGEELSWYLERYYTWPTGVFKERAQKVEKQLPQWGNALYKAVLHDESVREVLIAWRSAKGTAAQRFTIFVDSQLIKGKENDDKEKQKQSNEAATLLFGLPWELLHDGHGYLFQGAKPILVRRRLPNRRSLEGTVAEPPIRILLVSPRPEDDRAGYIDHRVSALPLVTALETLGELAELTVLSPPTFPALSKELQRARKAGIPYHVVHFDGHGIFRKELGLGGLCFENPQDSNKLEGRRSQIIDAKDLAAVIRDYRIPMFFLEACETAKAEQDPTASVAAALLEEGVASVVAMSHSVLVETARRFVESFYKRLTTGTRVGEAMLSGQCTLKDDSYRMKIFGAGQLDLQDWFVPVLYQEKQDLQLLTRVPSRQIKAVDKQALENRFGALPPTPEHSFVGRSRELLKLERLLEQKSYAVLCGQGGEGKTTLAAELARWLVRSNRFDRTAFVCFENIYDVRTVVDQIGQQLVPSYSVAEYSASDLLTKALQPIERALRDDHTMIILDNMESILPPPQSDTKTSLAEIARFSPEMQKTFFELCQKLMAIEDTRILFTSRETLPEPFDLKFHYITLSRLTKQDAIDLVHKTMTANGLTPKEDGLGGTQPEIEALVEAVNCHARSLVLLAPYISEFGVQHTTDNLSRLMAELDKKYPNERERSLFASVELSLRRLSPEIREKIKPLGVFQGGADLFTLAYVLELNEKERDSLVGGLVEIGLAEPMPYGFLRFHPALCPYLWQELDEKELANSKARWAESMQQLSDFLYEQRSKNAQLSATLTTLELPNLMRLLEYLQAKAEPETTVNLAIRLEQLIAPLGRSHLLTQVVAIREAETKKLGDWSHTRYYSLTMQIERFLDGGNIPKALQEMQALLDICLQKGEQAYAGADYDIADAHFLLGRVMSIGGAAEAALQPIDEAYRRFQLLADQGNTSAAGMASKSLTEKGDCLVSLGRLGEAESAYKTGIKISEDLGDLRSAAVKKGQLGWVYIKQERYDEALKVYHEALKTFENLGEPASVATIWHQIGMVHEEAKQFEAAEHAYRQALAIVVQQNNPAGEASSLDQLGILYGKMNRLEESVTFHKKAADIRFTIKDQAAEGRSRNNLAIQLITLKRYDEARQEIRRAIECDKPYGHASEPWKTWMILQNLEQAVGNQEAAAQAREQAVQLYLAYRRDGGENHNPGGRLCAQFWQAIQENRTEQMANRLSQLASDPQTHPLLKPLISKLQAILADSRDPELAADPELYYTDATEVLFLLEKLGKSQA